jgi:hypothetical protein
MIHAALSQTRDECSKSVNCFRETATLERNRGGRKMLKRFLICRVLPRDPVNRTLRSGHLRGLCAISRIASSGVIKIADATSS